MSARAAETPSRVARTIAASTTSCLAAAGLVLLPGIEPAAANATAGAGSATTTSPATTANTTTGPGSSSIGDLQTRAEELASEIAADGRTIDELDASYDAAEIRYSELSGQQTQLQEAITETTGKVDQTRAALKEQAVLAYLSGGAPVIEHVPDLRGQDPGLTASYAEIVAGGEKTAAEAYRATLSDQAKTEAALADNTQQAQLVLSEIHSSQAQAAAAMGAEQAALSQVNGQLAAAVAQVQAQQQQAEEAAVRSTLAGQGQLPPENPPAAQTNEATAPDRTPTPAPTTTSTTKPKSAISAGPSTGRSTTTLPPQNASSPVVSGTNQPAPGSDKAISYAEAQLGKPYAWGGAGPNSFDCSGLVMMAWEQAGVYFPHLAQAQYNMTTRIPLSNLLPGDLVFFGTPSDVYHVGIYIGNGNMIDAPQTGENVSIQNIYWSDLLGGGRVQ